MQKKKDKKQHSRTAPRLMNVDIGDLDMLDNTEYDHDRKSSHRSVDHGTKSFKNALVLEKGRIVEVKSNYSCIVQLHDRKVPCSISGRLKQFRFETRVLAAVGDWVQVDVGNADHPRIEEILPRRNRLSRYSEGSFQTEIILASNIDQIIIISSAKMPIFKPGLIDRYLCIAQIQNLDAIICVNKMDLVDDPAEIRHACSYYEKCGIPVVYASAETGEGIEQLRNFLKDKDSIFSGQSGVGKSTLINAIQPSLALKIGEISSFNEKGKHTTTQAIMLDWDFGGHLVDTPGLKTVNLHREDKSMIPEIFPGFEELRLQCKFPDCTHFHEEGCAIQSAVEYGEIPYDRYESYQRIYESL
ncbi:MAG TPA: ribosome small subunit-dependent GTPase A [Candidatus Cloacimonadota bacterium]|nr:ribosome small subunit-dependent GTPase A [Candidatus Cloacimonadota bacterium]HPT71118.1 ribosome small subunit-dependent GTPase A [Candidatus Cloacimonadota bacterium]